MKDHTTNSGATETPETSGAAEQINDYSPKTLTRREQVVCSLKMAAVAAMIFLVLWLIENHARFIPR